MLSNALSAQFEAGIIATLRTLTPAQKLELARDMNRMADRLALAGIQRRHPEADPQQRGYRLAIQRLTPEQHAHGAAVLQGVALMPNPVDPLELALRLGATLDAHHIPYVIVGSVAAVVHGEYRMTRDLDVVVNLRPAEVSGLSEALQAQFIFLPDDIRTAVRRLPAARADATQRAGFCAYDKATGFQLDVYLASGRPFEIAQFQRAQVLDFTGEPGRSLRVASAEDTVLAKLEWYNLSPSDRQWRDVQAILRVQDDLIDEMYLRQWSAQLGVADLLEWALQGQQPPQPGVDPRQQRLF